MADNMKPYELGITAHACLQLEKILAGIVRQLIQRRLIGEEFRFIVCAVKPTVLTVGYKAPLLKITINN